MQRSHNRVTSHTAMIIPSSQLPSPTAAVFTNAATCEQVEILDAFMRAPLPGPAPGGQAWLCPGSALFVATHPSTAAAGAAAGANEHSWSAGNLCHPKKHVTALYWPMMIPRAGICCAPAALAGTRTCSRVSRVFALLIRSLSRTIDPFRRI